jgi:hypothetical protein
MMIYSKTDELIAGIYLDEGELTLSLGRLIIGIGFRSAGIAYGSSFCWAWARGRGIERLS